MTKLLITVLLVLLVVAIVLGCRDKFSNTENRKVYNMFKTSQEHNDTFNDFRDELKKNKINFSGREGAFSFGGGVNFDQYLEMMKGYNKQSLNIDTVDKIRTQ